MRWWILALLFVARVGNGLQFQTMASAGDSLTAAFGLDNATIGLLIGLFSAPGLFLAMPAGILGRFAPDRVLASAGLGAMAIGAMVSATAPGLEVVALGRLLSGAGFLLASVYLTKMVADWFEGREIATAMSIFVASWPFGIAMAQIGQTWLSELFGWRMPFLVTAAYCALAALAIFALYRAPATLPKPASGRMSWLLPQEWLLIGLAGISWAIFNGGFVVWLSFGPKMLVAQGTAVLAAASIISVGSWIMILSGTACGQVVDRFGHAQTILAIAMGTALVALALLAVPGAGLIASLLFGVIGMAPAGIIFALASKAVAPERRAFGMGIFFTIYYAIVSIAPPVAGWIFDRTGSATGAIIFGACLFALVLPTTFLFKLLNTTPRGVALQEGV